MPRRLAAPPVRPWSGFAEKNDPRPQHGGASNHPGEPLIGGDEPVAGIARASEEQAVGEGRVQGKAEFERRGGPPPPRIASHWRRFEGDSQAFRLIVGKQSLSHPSRQGLANLEIDDIRRAQIASSQEVVGAVGERLGEQPFHRHAAIDDHASSQPVGSPSRISRINNVLSGSLRSPNSSRRRLLKKPPAASPPRARRRSWTGPSIISAGPRSSTASTRKTSLRRTSLAAWARASCARAAFLRPTTTTRLASGASRARNGVRAVPRPRGENLTASGTNQRPLWGRTRPSTEIVIGPAIRRTRTSPPPATPWRRRGSPGPRRRRVASGRPCRLPFRRPPRPPGRPTRNDEFGPPRCPRVRRPRRKGA